MLVVMLTNAAVFCRRFGNKSDHGKGYEYEPMKKRLAEGLGGL